MGEVPPFVSIALQVCERMEIMDKQGQGIIMKFCKQYPAPKIIAITKHAQTYVWWKKNPKAAFMKAVGEVNKKEKEANQTPQEKIQEIALWLSKHKDHEKYQDGLKAIKDLLEKHNLREWYEEQDFDFEVDMDALNK